MEYQAQQINRYHGIYDCFELKLTVNGKQTNSFVTGVGDETVASLSFTGFEGCTCRFYFGSDSGIHINGMNCVTNREGDLSRLSVSLPTAEDGLFFFHFELEKDGRLFYLSPSGITNSFAGEWQILVTNEKYSPVSITGGAIYHIFVDRFSSGGDVALRDDAVMLDPERDTPEFPEYSGAFLKNNTFFGGTLWGVADKLDYIKGIGADLIYLSPVFTAYSNHKYDTGDYMSVDAMFGGDEALAAVIDGCHRRGMKVILDGVFNHVGDDSIYFDSKGKYGGAYVNPASPYRDWFNIDRDGGYECWWGVKNLPKVIKCEGFQSYICDTVIPKYMKMGIDGWRLDVVDEYSQAFLERITAATKAYRNDAYILGEVWEDASNKTAYGERKKYFCGAALDGVMNYPFRNAVIDFVTNGNNEFITDVTTLICSHYPKEKLLSSMNMLGTHDTMRIMTVLGGKSPDGLSNSELSQTFMSDTEYAKAKRLFFACFALMAALSGKTAVYYGDEAGMQGYSDPFNRRPFPWGKEDTSITDFVRRVNLAKSAYRPLTCGDFDPIPTRTDVFAFTREADGKVVSCVSNMGASPFVLPSPKHSLIDNQAISLVPCGTTVLLDGDIRK